MWFIKIVTFIEYHPYLVLGGIVILVVIVRFFRREYKRPSYRQQRELERFLQGFKKESSLNEQQPLKNNHVYQEKKDWKA